MFIRRGILLILTLLIFCLSSGYPHENKHESRTAGDIEKFHAHEAVQKLLRENIKKIDLIEIISINFGYNDYPKLKKDYCMAKILVSKKQIVNARILLEHNLEDINKSMITISKDYEKATQEMIDECIDKINDLKFKAVMNPGIEINRKIINNEKKIKLANQQYDSAYYSFTQLEYVSAITLYRSAKTHAINILRDLAEPQDRGKINDKFKIHIVDNRNEVFKKG